MFGHWYNSSIRRYIVLMGDLFSHVQVARRREDTGTKFIKVPIVYASKEKFIAQLNKFTQVQNIPNPNATPEERSKMKAKIETILPRMNLHMVDMQYNPQFKGSMMSKTQIQNKSATSTQQVSQYSPTPIKMIFELGIYTRHQDDMYQIVEQIVPYFQPHFSTKITENHTNDIKIDRTVNIVVQSFSVDESIDGDAISRRHLEWGIMFEVNGWIYPPIADIEGEIRTVYVDFFGNMKELQVEGNFESVDSQVTPYRVEGVNWDGKLFQTYSEDTPIPVDPQPPYPRKEDI